MIDPNLVTTIRVGELPLEPFLLTDKIPHEVGVDLKSGTIQQLLDFLRPLVGKMQFEIVRLDVDAQYITDNFEPSGLGKNLCLGFAICNGNNGTKNRDGLVGLAYGSSYGAVGALGGSKNSIVVSHSHDVGGYNVGSGTPLFTSKGLDAGGDTVYSKTNTTGESGVDKNMQPYIVELTIMKL
jgi:hypothetical protein